MSVDTKEDDAGKPHADDTTASKEPELSESAKEAATLTEQKAHVKEMVEHLEKDDENPSSSPPPSHAVQNKPEKHNTKHEDDDDDDDRDEPSSATDEADLPEHLKEHAKKALAELRQKLEEAIHNNTLFRNKDDESQKGEEDDDNDNNNNNNNNNNDDDKGDQKLSVDTDISLWGVPLLPSRGNKSTDVLLIKFLRAKDFKAAEALDMLRSSLRWRKENKIDRIMEEDFGSEYDSVSYMQGRDRQGHPVCYNVYGVFADEAIYNKTFGSEGGRERFLRWRLQLLEKEIQKLDFSPGGISTLLQVNDLKDTPGPSRRDLRHATKQAVTVLQDNYPEFVSRNIFINVPFWYYAFNALLSPFLTQTTKSKFVFSRPARVTETLVKYIAAEEIPIAYGGLLREDDPEFSNKDVASEIIVKAGATECIEIPAPEIGSTLIWDVTIVGWDVNYKEEFVPSDPNSYTLIVKKQRKISWQNEPMRNSFKNKEGGKLVITVENGMFKKKKVLYRFKIKN